MRTTTTLSAALESLREYDTALVANTIGEEAGDDGGDTVATPAGGEHFVDQSALSGVGGLVSGVVFLEHFTELAWVFALEKNEPAAGESMLEGIFGRDFPRFSGLGTSGSGAV